MRLLDRLSHATDAQIAVALITAETVGLALIWLGHHLNQEPTWNVDSH